MPSSTTGRSSPAPSVNPYDDEAPLTQGEEEALLQMEAASRSSDLKDSDSPPPKKRKRGLSASPHLTPSRLRSSVKPTARAVDAGYKPNTSHAFRQDFSSSMPPPNPAISNGAPVDAEAKARRSASIDPSQQNIQPGGHGNHSSVATANARRSLSIDPAQPAVQTGERGNPDGMAEHTGAHYHRYPPIPHLQSAHQYMAYPGSGHPHPHIHPHSMPPPYFQPPGLPYGNLQNSAFYPNPPLQGHIHSRAQADMPTEGPHPAADVFSPQYIPADHQRSLQAPAPQPAARSTSSSSTRRSTPVPARSLTPSDNIPHLPLAASAVTEVMEPAIEPAKRRGDSAPPAPPMIISVQPATPLPAIPEGSHANCRKDRERDEDALDRASKLEDSPTVGRMSNAARSALNEGFKDLDTVLKRISVETGLAPAQIVERWDATKTRLVNSWNIYQNFFEERREEELARLPPEMQPPAGGLPSKATVAACYERFKISNSDNYDDVLRAWHRLHLMMDTGEMTISQRTRQFQRHADKIDSLIRQASSIYGFESICITVGGVVNQDQNLAQMIGSDATIDFFSERYRSSDCLTLGHMKAHVYDRLSKRMLLDDELPNDSTSTAGIVVKKESTPVGEVAAPTIHDLREKFIELASRQRITVTKGSGLLWRALPQVIADAGCVLLNWPEDVPFPCDEAGKNTSKGISVLKQPARILLFAAFDHPTNPLSIEKRYKSAVPADKPVIIGVPPDSSSPHAYGRRKFLGKNLHEDRQGPPRLKVAAGSKATGRMSKKEPSAIVKKAEVEDDSDTPMRLPDSAEDGEDANEDAKPRAQKKKSTSKKKSQVQFVVPDDTDDPAYGSSQDGSAQYSCSEDDIPIARSPHRLRHKTSKDKKGHKKQVVPKQRSKIRPHSSTEDEEVSEAESIVELDANPAPKPSKSDKRNHAQPIVERVSTDKVAEALFGDLHRTKETSKSTPSASASAVHANPKPALLTPALQSDRPPRTEPVQSTIPYANSTPAPPAPAPHTNPPPIPQHQGMVLSKPQPPAFGQERETFYPAGYPAAYSEAYGGRYAPPEHHFPANWGPAPGQGWYPPGPGPGNPPPPLPSNPPTSGPAHHGGYWKHQGPPIYPHPYGHYLAPNAQAAHPPQDDVTRTRDDSQAGPSM